MSELRLIRKYVNRRLYDTTQSRYVNLQDVGDLITTGAQVKVVEQATGLDITTPVLLQIIAEGQRGGAPLLSADFLAGMIRLGTNDRDPELAGRLDRALKSALTAPGRPIGVPGMTAIGAAAASAAG